ncbi:uncharacterized protein [Littorina saxatilis]|uniref:Uncharacterized protein n=2 Tax=Littorina saxatilis TaxID=31220 RepID=A0AAN9B524_9CAEN
MNVVRWSRRSPLLLLAVLLVAALAVVVFFRGHGNDHKLLPSDSEGKLYTPSRADAQRQLGGGDSKAGLSLVRSSENNNVKANSGFGQKEQGDSERGSEQKGAVDSQNKSGHGVKASSGSGIFNALLRILVLTYNRGQSLSRCLASLNDAEYDGKRVEVEIHIDRSKSGIVHNETLEAANSFVFKHGRVQVVVKPKHGGVLGQWLRSWRVPEDNTSEIAVFVEDDITLSPYFARYLRRVHEKYDSYPGINGYALQAESIRHAVGSKHSRLQGPEGEVVFLYPVLGSWGFSPHTGQWRDFIRWYNESSQKKGFKPAVPGLMPTGWYNSLYNTGRAETMWTMWHIHHAYQNKVYTVYTHFPQGKCLAFNWKEPGEHYGGKRTKGLKADLLDTWKEEDFKLPDKLQILNAKGDNIGKLMTPTGIV